MALEYKVKNCRTITVDGSKKKEVGFMVTDTESEQSLACNKELNFVDGKTDEQYLKECADLVKSDVDEWQESFLNIGKTFNISTGKFE